MCMKICTVTCLGRIYEMKLFVILCFIGFEVVGEDGKPFACLSILKYFLFCKFSPANACHEK